jgi:hypothetical protein
LDSVVAGPPSLALLNSCTRSKKKFTVLKQTALTSLQLLQQMLRQWSTYFPGKKSKECKIQVKLENGSAKQERSSDFAFTASKLYSEKEGGGQGASVFLYWRNFAKKRNKNKNSKMK